MAVNLTTRYLFKTYAKISGTTDDTLIDYLVTWVSEALAKHLVRTFESTTYYQWLDGTGSPTILLPEWPVTALHVVSLQTTRAIYDITNTSASHATVSLFGGNLMLRSASSVGVVTATTKALSSYLTPTLLAAQITGTAGWSCSVESDAASLPSYCLKPVFAQYALSPDKVDIDIADESEPCEIVYGSDQLVELQSGLFPYGKNNVFAWYTAGYTLPVDNEGHTGLTTAGNVPGNLTMVCNEIIRQVLNACKQAVGALQSETIGPYSYTISEEARGVLAASLKKHDMALTPYKSMRVI